MIRLGLMAKFRNEDWHRDYRWAGYDNVSPYDPSRRHIKPVNKEVTDDYDDEFGDEDREDESEVKEW